MCKQTLHDLDIIEVDTLDPELAANLSKPWAVRYFDGTTIEVETEEAARQIQHAHRTSFGRHPH